MLYVLDDGGDVQTPDAWCGKLSRVYVGDFSHSGVHVFQVLSLHYQDRLSRVKVELPKEKTEILDGEGTETVHDKMLTGTVIHSCDQSALSEVLQIYPASGGDTTCAYETDKAKERRSIS